MTGKQRQIPIDLFPTGIDPGDSRLLSMKGCKGETLNRRGPWRFRFGAIDQSPKYDGYYGNSDSNEKTVFAHCAYLACYTFSQRVQGGTDWSSRINV
jgi:hypothetical protein